MPLYEYKCKWCAKLVTVVRSVAERRDPLKCEDCGQPCIKLISKTAIKIDYSDISHFGDPRHVDDKRRKAGIAT